jgi:phosphoglycolate phosphatase-like HAD superfamily hydrolase
MSRGASGYGGIVFDLDGTLIDTMPFVLEGLATAVAPYRRRPTPEEVMSSLGGPSEACVRRLLGGTRHLVAALAAYLRFLRQNDHVARPFRGARTLLKDLECASVRIGIWTGRERDSTLARLRALRWEHCFNPVICGDDLPSHKPDPAGLRKIIRCWRLRPHQALFVGDSDQDIEGGCAAGVPMLAIDHGRSIDPGPLRRPVAVVATPAAAYGWVRNLVLAGRR